MQDQKKRSVPTVFIAGAGCSRGTLDGNECLRPPTAKDFVTDLKSRVPEWAGEYPEISKVVKHLERTPQHVGLEELWTCIDLHAKFPEAFPVLWEPRGPVVRELKSLLVRMYGSSCDELADKVSSTDPCTVATIAKEIQAGDSLISFNYDTVIERIVRHLSTTELRHGKDLRPGTIRFAKPHGSASWPIGSLNYRLTDGEPMWDSLHHADVKNHGGPDPLLLGAVPLKSELIFEVQEYYGARPVFEVIREQWRTVANAVGTAERIVVLGYSFPKEDTYGRFFFREGMTMRNSDLPLQVDFYNRSGDQSAIQDVFPKANPICFKGPVTPAAV
jgi:hypothetical protein